MTSAERCSAELCSLTSRVPGECHEGNESTWASFSSAAGAAALGGQSRAGAAPSGAVRAEDEEGFPIAARSAPSHPPRGVCAVSPAPGVQFQAVVPPSPDPAQRHKPGLVPGLLAPDPAPGCVMGPAGTPGLGSSLGRSGDPELRQSLGTAGVSPPGTTCPACLRCCPASSSGHGWV